MNSDSDILIVVESKLGKLSFRGNADTAFQLYVILRTKLLLFRRNFAPLLLLHSTSQKLRSNIKTSSLVGNRWLSFGLFITFIIPEIHSIIHHIFNHWRKSLDLNNLLATSTANCSFILSLRNLIPTLKCYTFF